MNYDANNLSLGVRKEGVCAYLPWDLFQIHHQGVEREMKRKNIHF